MSLIIKGLDMPKDTERVEIIFWHSIGEKDEYILQHNLDVEAVEIPTPHGRLIDGDELSPKLWGYERWTGISELPYEYAIRELDSAPTIIEAER